MRGEILPMYEESCTSFLGGNLDGNARFVQYINPRDFSRTPGDDPDAGDLGPEGLAFIAAEDSPIDVPMLVVGNEVSGTTAFLRIDVIELD
jgi:hypothetical protein